MLRGYRFPPQFTTLIMAFVINTRFFIMVNRESHGLFKEKRGLREKDPISSLLFLLVMDIYNP